MNKKMMAVLGAAVVIAGAISGIAFASNINDNPVKDNQSNIIESEDNETNEVFIMNNIKEKDITKDNYDNTNFKQNSANNPEKAIYKDMIKIMRDNGYKDAARYMETGNYDAMTDHMNNISQEDYDEMIQIMDNNGYNSMGQMMESIGREGMIEMHNSMEGMHGNNYNNMMGGY